MQEISANQYKMFEVDYSEVRDCNMQEISANRYKMFEVDYSEVRDCTTSWELLQSTSGM